MTSRFSFTAPLLLSVAVLCSSCRKPEIRVYTVPKDPPPAPTQMADGAHPTGAPSSAKPKVTWVLPTGWQEAAPNEVSVAGFVIKNGPAEATVSIAPLPNMQGQEAMIINMYRQQTGLPPLDPSEVPATLSPIPVSDGEGRLLELTGNNAGQPVKMITAIAHRDGRSWFIRLSGEQALVTAQKPAFLDFLKSLHFVEGAAGDAAPMADATSAAPGLPAMGSSAPAGAAPSPYHWTVPPGWQELPPGQMQVGKFAVVQPDGAKADVFVSIFPTDTGGTLDNVNRWRRQLGLSNVDEAGLAAMVTPLDPALPRAILVSITNSPRALLGAIVPRGEQWWFYKLLGDAPAVNGAHDAFVSFVKTEP